MDRNRTRASVPAPFRVLGAMMHSIGYFYLAAIATAVISIYSFVTVAELVTERELHDTNRGILLEIHRYAGPTLTDIALTLSWIGSEYGVGLIALGIGAVWYRRRRFVDMWTLPILLLGCAILTHTLKTVFGEVRPQVFTPLATELNFSFPSGHSTTGFSLWGYLGAVLVLERPRRLRRWLALGACLVFAGMIALSRLYLGVHWPTDVVAGMIVAAFWLSICLSARRWMVTRRMRRAPAQRP